ncbi:hypothetical protein [Sphingomicrobium marinum]|uniref:hypothetical protein n=1 Tax=Sphingomicrobium marinum TaxID=1227950 RepID=UPI00223FDBBC|nr:hypothetical protein [Sphingomicrobium marinum]
MTLALVGCGNDTASLNEIEAERTEEISSEARAIFEEINDGKFIEEAVEGFAVGFRNTVQARQLEAQYPGIVDEFLSRSKGMVRHYYQKEEPAMSARIMRTFDDNMTAEQRAEFLDFIKSETGQIFFGKIDLNEQLEQSGAASLNDLQAANVRAGMQAANELTPEQQAEVVEFEKRLEGPLLAVGQAQTEALYDVIADFQKSPEKKRIGQLLERMVEERAGS